MGQVIPFITAKQVREVNPSGQDFTVYPSGDYVLRTTGIELGMSQTQNRKMVVKAKIIEGPGKETAHRDQGVTFSITLKDNALFGFEQFVRACGVNRDGEENFNTDDFVEKVFKVTCTVETYKDEKDGQMKERNSWKRYRVAEKNGN